MSFKRHTEYWLAIRAWLYHNHADVCNTQHIKIHYSNCVCTGGAWKCKETHTFDTYIHIFSRSSAINKHDRSMNNDALSIFMAISFVIFYLIDINVVVSQKKTFVFSWNSRAQAWQQQCAVLWCGYIVVWALAHWERRVIIIFACVCAEVRAWCTHTMITSVCVCGHLINLTTFRCFYSN